jgi:hypothetical protein
MTIYKLLYPVTVTTYPGDGSDERHETIASVEVRRPVAKDFRMLDSVIAGDVGKSLAMIEQLTGLMRVQVDKLDGLDMTAIGAIIEGFMEPGPPTGGTP